jgi:hypothetical protein
VTRYFTRREILEAAAGLAAGGLAGAGIVCCGSSSGGKDQGAIPGPEGRQGERLAVTMWEFSWLVRRQGRESEYADWDKVLDQLAERGYNCIRMDAFPHLVARGPGGERGSRFTVLPQTPLFFWGNHDKVEIEPRADLVAFLRKVRDRGMRVGLSSWFVDDTTHRAASIATPRDFARVWAETLDVVSDAGLLEMVAWVDVCNEFPLGRWAPGAYREIFGESPTNVIPLVLPWSEATRARVQAYLDEAIGSLRATYPNLRYTFSVEDGLSGPNMRTLDTASLDIAEVHIWVSNDPEFSIRSGQLFLLLEFPGSLDAHVKTAPEVYYPRRDHWLEVLGGRMEVWRLWAQERGLPLFTTEGWGPVNYDDVGPTGDAGEWEWVRDVCAEAVRMACEKGWTGICTSNFCQPHFEGMWQDVSWHRDLTDRILWRKPLGRVATWVNSGWGRAKQGV